MKLNEQKLMRAKGNEEGGNALQRNAKQQAQLLRTNNSYSTRMRDLAATQIVQKL